MRRSNGCNGENVSELEEIFGGDPEKGFRCVRPFAFCQANLEFLPLAEEGADDRELGKVIFEKDGVPYIDGDACGRDEGVKEKLNADFAKLVEAVVCGKGSA